MRELDWQAPTEPLWVSQMAVQSEAVSPHVEPAGAGMGAR